MKRMIFIATECHSLETTPKVIIKKQENQNKKAPFSYDIW